MKFWAAVTDNQWFRFLAPRRPDEVNFWQPSAKSPWRGLQPGTPFLFKLKRPNHHIAGGGFFVRFSTLPLSLAWEAFGWKNGATSMDEFLRLIEPLLGDRVDPDPEIGCSILSEPFFFERAAWIDDPDDFAPNVVRGRSYDTDDPTGDRLWSRVALAAAWPPASSAEQPARRFGQEHLVRPRLGQGGFRIEVTEAYRRRCAVTGESTLPVLEAAHIRPFAKDGVHDIANGMLLRSDFHTLFDKGLFTVDPDLRVVISPRIRQAWFNGKVYYRLHGKPLAVVPEVPASRPDRELLRWHNENVFQD